jgi:hypothetical protein
MLTANDLKNIDWFLAKWGSICNQPEEDRKLCLKIRARISEELAKIPIKVKRK